MLRCGLALLALSLAPEAYAQRGLAPAGAGVVTPLSGFPGLFDTFIPEKGAVVTGLGILGGLPSAPVDVGLSDSLSLGTNALILLPWLEGMPAAALRVRLRSTPTSWLAVAVTGYGAYAKVVQESEGTSAQKKSEPLEGFGYMATLNASVFLSANTWFTGSVLHVAGKLEQGETSSDTYQRLEVGTAMFAGTAEHFLTDWVGLRLTAGSPFLLSLAVDGGIRSASGALSAQTKALFLGGLGADFRLGESWLLSPTVLGIFSRSDKSVSIAAEGAYKW